MNDQSDSQKTPFSTATALENIQHFSNLLASTTDLKSLYKHVVSEIKTYFKLDFSTLLLFDKERKHLVIRDTDGFPDEMIDTFMLKEGQGLPTLALQSGKVETVEDFRTENRFEVTDIMFDYDICSSIAAPMKISNTIFGVIIGHIYEKRIFCHEEKLVLQVLANHAAIALNNSNHLTSLYSLEKNRELQIAKLQKEEQATKEITDEFESIFSNIVTGIIFLKGSRLIARCNKKFAEMLGYDSVDELIGKSVRNIHTSEENYRTFGRTNYSNMVSGKIVQTEFNLKKKDGTSLLCRLSGRALDQSEPPDIAKGFVWVIEDISQRKRMEEEVLQARKLESIGILAGGIGHDFNNILSVILGNLGLAQRLLSKDSEIQDLLDSALEASMRAKDLTGKLLLFTRKDSHSIGSVDLKKHFEEYNYRRYLQKKVQLKPIFSDDLHQIKILPDHLTAILTNLLLNADGFIEKEGEIKVIAKNRTVGKNEIPNLQPAEYIEIQVIDNGSGIEGKILENIFDPYFTTKTRDSSRGSGLGLALVHSIVKRNNGFISVSSDLDKGTTFTIMLPASTREILSYQKK